MAPSILALCCARVLLVVPLAASPQSTDPRKLADTYVEAVERINAAHAAKPARDDEAALQKKLPKAATVALDALLKHPGVQAAPELLRCGEAALDLDLLADFERVRENLQSTSPEVAKRLGLALSRPRFVLRGFDGVEDKGLERIAAALDEILTAYDQVFGFQEWSKVPGKKLRVRVHLVEKITEPPHFAPQLPWHSEIDFPVVDPDGFSSPTADGKFQFYGLCHELGHVIAMWGDANKEEDHHAWAHYTGVAIVEHLAERKDEPALEGLRDVQWRSLSLERHRLHDGKHPPGRDDRDSVTSLFIAVHDLLGPRAIGDAINALDKEDKRLRVNRVRYYELDDFATALRATPAGKAQAAKLRALFE
jgi:hypothetical protein